MNIARAVLQMSGVLIRRRRQRPVDLSRVKFAAPPYVARTPLESLLIDEAYFGAVTPPRADAPGRAGRRVRH